MSCTKILVASCSTTLYSLLVVKALVCASGWRPRADEHVQARTVHRAGIPRYDQDQSNPEQEPTKLILHVNMHARVSTIIVRLFLEKIMQSKQEDFFHSSPTYANSDADSCIKPQNRQKMEMFAWAPPNLEQKTAMWAYNPWHMWAKMREDIATILYKNIAP